MEHAEIELLLGREMSYTGHKRLPERAIIGPSGKDFVDGRVVNGWLSIGVCRNGQALPLHPRIQDPQDEVKNAVIAQFEQLPKNLSRKGCAPIIGETT